jgi:hypothetical protein
VNIPNVPKPEYATLSSAWDYAARVCLRVRESLLLWPPQASADRNIDGTAYGLFSGLGLLSANQLNAFELRHLSTPAKNVRGLIRELKTSRPKATESYEYNSNKLPPSDTIHISLPRNAALITKLSVEWLFGAIVCLVLRDISKEYWPIPKSVVREFSMSIFTAFSLFVSMADNRHRVDWSELFDLFKDVKDGSGHHAASAASSTDITLRKTCSKNVRRDSSDFVEMEFSTELQNWKCPRCGGTERMKARMLTPAYIHKIQDRVLQKREDVFKYIPYVFEKVKSMYNYIISKNKEDFLERFKEYENLAIKDLLIKKEGYFIVHYDASKRWKKRSCYISNNALSQVEIVDPRYFSQYRPMIKQLIALYDIKAPYEERSQLFTNISNTLKMLGWPERHLNNKILADTLMF